MFGVPGLSSRPILNVHSVHYWTLMILMLKKNVSFFFKTVTDRIFQIADLNDLFTIYELDAAFTF